jgi:hypothetical protein
MDRSREEKHLARAGAHPTEVRSYIARQRIKRKATLVRSQLATSMLPVHEQRCDSPNVGTPGATNIVEFRTAGYLSAAGASHRRFGAVSLTKSWRRE